MPSKLSRFLLTLEANLGLMCLIHTYTVHIHTTALSGYHNIIIELLFILSQTIWKLEVEQRYICNSIVHVTTHSHTHWEN